MACNLWLLICNVLVVWLSFASAESNYTLYISKTIRPGFEITFTINLLSGTNPVELTCSLKSKDYAFSKTVNSTIEVGSSSSVSLGTVPIGYEGSPTFMLNVTGIDSVTGEVLFENSTDEFVFASKALSVLIQTDKAIYQPGQIIKFRAICLRPNLRPFTGNVTYQVLDPNDNIVVLENDVPLSHGVAGGEFPLSRDSVDGYWKIAYIVAEHKETLSVKVEFYKLPKFEVTIDSPSIIHRGSAGLSLTISGKYTYGKPVDGSASLVVTSSHYQSENYFPIYGYRPSRIARTLNTFDGKWEVFFPMSLIQSTFGWRGNSGSDMTLDVTASVTESLTGTTFNETRSVEVKWTNIKIDVVYKLITIKPGLSYSAYIRVSEQDGSALSNLDRLNNKLIVDVTYNYPPGHVFPEDSTPPPPSYLTRNKNEVLLFDIPPDGLIQMALDVKNEEFESVQFYVYTNTTAQDKYSHSWTATRAVSPSNSYLQIVTSDNNISPGSQAQMTVRTTEEISGFDVMLISRGEIVGNFSYTAPNGEVGRTHAFNFLVTASMTPNLQVLVSYVRGDGEIVADFTVISVSVQLENQVSIRSSSNTVDAGDDVNITVQTSSSGAYVGLRAIDKSVLLLRSGSDISRDRVIEDLNGYSVSDSTSSDNDFFPLWCWYPRPSGAKDASDVFKEAGLLVLTNALLYEENESYNYHYIAEYNPGAPVEIQENIAFDSPVKKDHADSEPVTPDISVRSFFPETWLWEKNLTQSDGSASFYTKAPDTITSWVLSAFSVSDQYGFGVANTSKVRVVLSESDKFELIIPGDDAEAAGNTRSIRVPGDSAVSVYFPIELSTLGEVPVTVTAISELAQDAVTRRVFVRPEGIQQCYSTSTFISRSSASDPDSIVNMLVRIPSESISGSGKVNLYVYGDLLGSTMQNLGRLLQTPSGCGEQNMIGFAPNVFVTLYLSEAGLLDQQTRMKAYRNFQQGYSNELNYKHSNGSYSAFGSSDPSGSTWLTAFVAKCFMFARILRPELVEKRIIDQALYFLTTQQNEDGSMREPGRVIHTDMQGDVSSPLTLTAYVLIAFKETNFTAGNETIDMAASKARRYLEANLDSVRTQAYPLSLVTYALQVSGSSLTDSALSSLNQLATVSGAEKYWSRPTPEASSYSDRWAPPYYQPPTNEIEMTAYALLIYARRNDLAPAIPIIKWLTSKQNDLGGYSSTQDTVIAIQALSTIAGLMSDNDQSLSVTATHEGDSSFSETFNINRVNRMVFHTTAVPSVDGNVAITSSGVGSGVAQLSVCYNIPSSPYDEEPFRCESSVDSSDLESALVEFCCRLKPGENATGMFLFELSLLNGYTVDVDDEKLRNNLARMVEMDDGKLNIYFDQLPTNLNLCANVKLQRYADVGAVKAAPLIARDYYKPEKRVDRLYSLAQAAEAGVCDVCGSKCVGCPGNGGGGAPLPHLIVFLSGLLAFLISYI